MKKLLPILLISLSLLICVNADQKSVGVSLSSTQFKQDQQLTGSLTLNNLGTLPKSTKIISYINNNKISEKTLFDIINDSNLNISLLSETYGIDFLSDSKTIDFTSNYLNELIAIKLPKDSIIKDSQINLLSQLNKPADNLKLDIGSDGTIEWFFLGNTTGWESDLLPSTSRLLTETSTLNLKGTGYGSSNEYYCEEINLSLSKSFNIKTKYQWIGDSQATLYGNILNENAELQTIQSCEFPREEIRNWYNCTLDLEDAIKGNYFVCVYLHGGLSDINYIQLAFESQQDTSAYRCDSYHCSEIGNKEYFIKVAPGIHKTKLENTAVFSQNLDEVLTEYLKVCTPVNDECIILINLSVSAPGELKINNMAINYEDKFEDLITINNFYTEVSLKESQYNFEEITEIPLELLDLKAPLTNGSTTLKIEIEDFENKTSFETVYAPITNFTVSDDKVSVNQQVYFDASSSYSRENTEIKDYSWNFGDGSKANGKTTIHNYPLSGIYDVSLEVTDSEGITSSLRIMRIEVRNITKRQLDEQIENLQGKISDSLNITSSHVGVKKEISELLSQEQDLKRAEIEIARIKGSITNETDLNEILQELQGIKNSTLYSISILNEILGPGIIDEDGLEKSINLLGIRNKEETMQASLPLLNKIVVYQEIRTINLNYLSGDTKKIVFIKKQITPIEDLSNIILVEYIPTTFKVIQKSSDLNLLENSFKILLTSFKRSNSKTLIYIVEGKDTEILTEIKTTIVSDLKEKQTITEPESKQLPISFILIPIAILTILIILIYLIKRTKLFKIKKTPKNLFKSNIDITNLETYVKKALERKIPKTQIRDILLKKGWKENQINYIFKKIKK